MVLNAGSGKGFVIEDGAGSFDGGNPMFTIDSSSNIIFNQGNIDSDFSIIEDGGTTAFFVQGSDGNVGIGTASPSNKLEVVGSSTDPTTIDLDSGGHAYSQIDSGSSSYESLIRFMDAGSTKFTLGLDNDASHTVFSIGDNALANKWLSIDNTGNVGIGTTTPNFKFQVIATPTTNSYGVSLESNQRVLNIVGSGNAEGIITAAMFPTNTNSIKEILRLVRNVGGGVGANGIGSSINMHAENDAGSTSLAMGKISWVYSNVTAGAEESFLAFDAMTAGSLGEVMRLQGNGNLNVTGSIDVGENVTLNSGAKFWSSSTCAFISSPSGTTILEVCD